MSAPPTGMPNDVPATADEPNMHPDLLALAPEAVEKRVTPDRFYDTKELGKELGNELGNELGMCIIQSGKCGFSYYGRGYFLLD